MVAVLLEKSLRDDNRGVWAVPISDWLLELVYDDPHNLMQTRQFYEDRWEESLQKIKEKKPTDTNATTLP